MADTAAILAVFRVVADEFASTADSVVEAWISIEVARLSAFAFGTALNEAVARRVAHELTLKARNAAAAGSGSAVGAVTSVRTGDLSLGYGGSGLTAGSDAEIAYYQQTTHGIRFLLLRDSRPYIGPMVIR